MERQTPIATDWTPQLAYCVGLIASDGSVSKDGRHLDFTSKDRDLVETFLECLGRKVKIGTKNSGSSADTYFRVQMGDKNFWRWLNEIGIGPSKSLTLGEVNVPEAFFFDFLRGCFDGDGTSYAYDDPRWPKSRCVYLAFNSASLHHLEWLKGRLAAEGIVGSISKGARCWILRYAKTASRTLADRMYYSPGVPCLVRKQAKIQGHFDMASNADVAE